MSQVFYIDFLIFFANIFFHVSIDKIPEKA